VVVKNANTPELKYARAFERGGFLHSLFFTRAFPRKYFLIPVYLIALLQIHTVQSGVQEIKPGQLTSGLGCSALSIASLQSEVNRKLDEPVWLNSPQASTGNSSAVTPTQYGYRIVKRYPHDHAAFTQGLVFFGNALYESTGLFGESTLREVDLQTGKVLRLTRLDKRFFGEGLTVLNNRFVQLTWKAGVALVYETENLIQHSRFDYPGEGWGSTSVGDRLLISNGSAVLTWLEPGKEGIADAIYVHEGDRLVEGLNELEYVEGRVLANVWPSDCVAEIDPHNGRVTGWIDLSGLFPHKSRPNWTAVLNGIAYNSVQKRLFVTGKFWPYIYEIERVEAQAEKQAATEK
jgi:glutamine cyclotransferase